VSAQVILAVVAVICLAVALTQLRRADRLIADVLRRESEHREARTELAQVFLDEQRRQEQRHEGERLQWRDERAELLNAALAAAQQHPVAIAPGWPGGQPEKLYHTEDDEVREQRARVAEEIDARLGAYPLMPDMGAAA
jgi:hypothetical protein